MSIELSITIKDDERTLKREFLVYEPVTFVVDDPTIVSCLNETLEEFKGEPEDIKVRAMMVLQ